MSSEQQNIDATQLHDDLHGFYIEDLKIGMSAAYAKTVVNADVVMFAGISGDTNPLHLNEEFSSGGVFKGRIAHGLLTASFLSAAIGTKLPGPGCIYLSQTLRFLAPVRVDDTVVARVTIVEINRDTSQATLSTICTVGGKKVLDGKAVIMVPSNKSRKTQVKSK